MICGGMASAGCLRAQDGRLTFPLGESNAGVSLWNADTLNGAVFFADLARESRTLDFSAQEFRVEDTVEGDTLKPKYDTPVLTKKKREPKERRFLGVKIPNMTLKVRMERDIKNYLFVPEGKWMGGLQVSYIHENIKDYEYLVLQDWDAGIDAFAFTPYLGYMIKDNMAVGFTFSYRNNRVSIDNLKIDLGDDLDFDIKNVYVKDKLYSVAVFMRNYVGLGASKRFGLFNDIILSYGRGTGRLYSGRNDPPVDTRQEVNRWNLGFKPGMSVFITNNVSFEASVGAVGVQYQRTKQFEDGIEVGSRKAAKANFKTDLLSLNLAISVYL